MRPRCTFRTPRPTGQKPLHLVASKPLTLAARWRAVRERVEREKSRR
jgi:hypothetical protein